MANHKEGVWIPKFAPNDNLFGAVKSPLGEIGKRPSEFFLLFFSGIDSDDLLKQFENRINEDSGGNLDDFISELETTDNVNKKTKFSTFGTSIDMELSLFSQKSTNVEPKNKRKKKFSPVCRDRKISKRKKMAPKKLQ
jgi:hypothetical protein